LLEILFYYLVRDKSIYDRHVEMLVDRMSGSEQKMRWIQLIGKMLVQFDVEQMSFGSKIHMEIILERLLPVLGDDLIFQLYPILETFSDRFKLENELEIAA